METEDSIKTQTLMQRSQYIHYILMCQAQIREQMSGTDLHVFTLKFLALKKLVFPMSALQHIEMFAQIDLF